MFWLNPNRMQSFVYLLLFLLGTQESRLSVNHRNLRAPVYFYFQRSNYTVRMWSRDLPEFSRFSTILQNSFYLPFVSFFQRCFSFNLTLIEFNHRLNAPVTTETNLEMLEHEVSVISVVWKFLSFVLLFPLFLSFISRDQRNIDRIESSIEMKLKRVSDDKDKDERRHSEERGPSEVEVSKIIAIIRELAVFRDEKDENLDVDVSIKHWQPL